MGDIILSFPSKLWKRFGDSYVTGAAYAKNKLLQGQGLLSLFSSSTQNDDLFQHLLSLNGTWALCLKLSDTKYVASVNRVNTRQIFYGKSGEGVCVSCEAEEVRKFVGDTKLDPIACDEYENARHVSGSNTLYPNVKQLKAGECLIVDKGPDGVLDIKVHRWFVFSHNEPNLINKPEQWDEPSLLRELDDLVMQAHEKLVDYADGRRIVLPLSGGFDSRTTAVALKRLAYENICAFSYGTVQNSNTIVAKQVASELNIPFRIVPYTRKLWRDTAKSKEYHDCFFNSHQYVACPHMLDFPALYLMLKDGYIDHNSLLAPGHTDYILGSTTPPILKDSYTDSDVYDYIFNYFYIHEIRKLRPDTEEYLHERIRKLIGDATRPLVQTDFSRAIEEWGWHETFCTFYINSMKSFEYFNLDYYLPLMDNFLMDFWLNVPMDIKRNRALQMKYVAKIYSEYTGCSISDALVSDRNRESAKAATVFMPALRKYIPKCIKHLKRHYEMYTNVWAWHYSLPAEARKEAARRGRLSMVGNWGHEVLKQLTSTCDKQ